MFDDLQKNNDEQKKTLNSNSNSVLPNKASAEGALPKKEKVEDIFSGSSDNPSKPEVFQPKELSSAAKKNEIKAHPDHEAKDSFDQADEKAGIKKLILGIIGALFLLAVIFISWLVLKNFLSKNSQDLESPESAQAPIEKEKNNQAKEESPIIPPHDDALLDTDQDGLPDQEEKKLGTDINNVDTDGDGLFDREEVMVFKTDSLNPDTDKDGINDGEEVRNGQNPNGSGSLYAESDPNAVVPSVSPVTEEENIDIDTDKDGLKDKEEQGLGTKIDNFDTDGDGISDYDEVRTYQTNPLEADTDKDGYSDGEEVKSGYNPKGEGKL